MYCPRCNKLNHCPCKGCTARREGSDEEFLLWVRGDDFTDACGNCGFTMSMEEWDELNWEEVKLDPKSGETYDPDYPAELSKLIKKNLDNNVPLPWSGHHGDHNFAWQTDIEGALD